MSSNCHKCLCATSSADLGKLVKARFTLCLSCGEAGVRRAAEAEEQIRRRAQAEPGGGPEAAAAAGDDAGSGEPEQHLVVDAFMVHDHDSNGEIAKLELYH